MPSSNPVSPRTPPARPSARQAAQDVVSQHQRKTSTSAFLRWTVIAVAVALVGIVVAVLIFTERASVPEDGSTPSAGNEYGGIQLLSPSELAPAAPAEIESLDILPSSDIPIDPQGVKPDPGQEAVSVVAWVDVNCVHCADFESTFGQQIQEWLADGVISMEYRTVAYLDRNSPTNYSSRAAAASACVAHSTPESYLPFMEALFANFPQGELSDAQLTELAAGVDAGDISTCVDDGTYRPWVDYGTEVAQRSGIEGTPTIYVDGKKLADPASLIAAVDAARGTR